MIMELCLMNRKRGGMNSWSYDTVASTDISLICKSCRSKSFSPVGDINETVNKSVLSFSAKWQQVMCCTFLPTLLSDRLN